MAEGTPWLEDGTRSPAGTSGVEGGGAGGGGGGLVPRASCGGPGQAVFLFLIGSQWGIADFDKGPPPT